MRSLYSAMGNTLTDLFPSLTRAGYAFSLTPAAPVVSEYIVLTTLNAEDFAKSAKSRMALMSDMLRIESL